MWTAVYVASGLEQATEVEKQLQAEGFLVKKRLFVKEEDEELYEILAPEFEAKDIQAVLYDLGII
ncbi:hypothetical protein [Clostridium sp. Cult3]|uniref:hypothetical protein n=1 Tax=Clostridium sp. Cult3 TaxID=2079004 RepID=UPI001F2C52F5|nr:hypothetical protein [Clostridium sp. Cult3]MCF6461771.1 hypothetical protein [Clostridium sp. Cult3]